MSFSISTHSNSEKQGKRGLVGTLFTF